MAAQDGATTTGVRPLSNVEQTRQHGHLRRLSTAISSFRVLKNLTPEQVDNFMNSYVIYDLDWADEKVMLETLGPDYQKKVGDCLRDYYSVLNHMCAIGELEKMYIPPVMDLQATIFTNQILYEESIAEELRLPDNARVLDLGCGRGRVAAHMTRISGARVTGINIDHDQVASAIAYNEEQKLKNNFIRADFNDLPLPLPDNEFDGFYQIQAFSLCKDIPKLCRELFRVLKPGARLSMLDWAKLAAFNSDDPHHLELMRVIKPLIGAVGTPTPESLVTDLESAGFQVLKHDNASIDGLQSPLIERADVYFRHAKWALLTLVRLGLLPAHFKTLFNRFTQDGEAFIEADRARLITTSYRWVAIKPNPDSDSPAGSSVSSKSEEALKIVDSDIANSTVPIVLPSTDKTESTPDTERSAEANSMSSSDPNLKSPSPADSAATDITVPSIVAAPASKSETLATPSAVATAQA